MSCKYPKESKSYMACGICSTRIGCPDATLHMEFQSQPTPAVNSSKDTIPLASEMNKITHSAIDKRNEEELLKIATLIRKTAEGGMFGIVEHDTLSEHVLMELRKLGYDAKNGEACYSIRWDDVE